MAGGFDIVHSNDFERAGKWRLARRTLGLTSFGMNLVDLQPGERIPEHHERERDQEEVFIVLSGTATMLIDGEQHPAPTGTFVRLDPEPLRALVNEGDGPATVLIASAPRSSGYEPLDWA
jgi:quercetin dioxygenase-like cupin family protein